MFRPALLAAAAASGAQAYLTDCRNQSWTLDGGKLAVMSYHIHYNTDSSDMSRFYNAFIKQFQSHFPPGGNQCPFGPNYGDNTYEYICSLEGAMQEHPVGLGDVKVSGQPWSGPQRAFFVTTAHIDAAWEWAQANKGTLDVLKHPNTGCMHDDHSLRARWNSSVRDQCDTTGECGTSGGAKCADLVKTYSCADYYAPGKPYAGWCDKTCGFPATDPSISILNFPCNMPGTGCNDNNYPGPPACGCSADLPLPDDAPEHSCKGCINQYTPP